MFESVEIDESARLSAAQVDTLLREISNVLERHGVSLQSQILSGAKPLTLGIQITPKGSLMPQWAWSIAVHISTISSKGSRRKR
jgi:hypothetical protein